MMNLADYYAEKSAKRSTGPTLKAIQAPVLADLEQALAWLYTVREGIDGVVRERLDQFLSTFENKEEA